MDTLNRTSSGIEIPESEVDFHPHSFGDPDGRLFWWKGGLYRGIGEKLAPFFTELLQKGVIQRLVDKKLIVDSEITSLTIEGYEMVVRHRTIPFPSYPHEWCVEMCKDAALTIVDLVIALQGYGLTLKDAHPWNLLFDNCDPLYVDLPSIAPITNGALWPSYEEFCRYCFYPLILMARGQERIARSLMSEWDGVRRSDLSIIGRSGLPKSIGSVDMASSAGNSTFERCRRSVEQTLGIAAKKVCSRTTDRSRNQLSEEY